MESILKTCPGIFALISMTGNIHFYADPPYLDTAGYGVDFPLDQYELLSEKMKTCKGKVMLSINDHEKIREIFKGFNFACTSINYSVGRDLAAKSKKSNELIIMNY